MSTEEESKILRATMSKNMRQNRARNEAEIRARKAVSEAVSDAYTLYIIMREESTDFGPAWVVEVGKTDGTTTRLEFSY